MICEPLTNGLWVIQKTTKESLSSQQVIVEEEIISSATFQASTPNPRHYPDSAFVVDQSIIDGQSEIMQERDSDMVDGNIQSTLKYSDGVYRQEVVISKPQL